MAYPPIVGVWTRRLALSPLLGFADQAMVLVAIDREYDVVAATAS
ncbi:hypothetical protein ACWDTI_09045 [Gordonia sp. NPDC003424]